MLLADGLLAADPIRLTDAGSAEVDPARGRLAADEADPPPDAEAAPQLGPHDLVVPGVIAAPLRDPDARERIGLARERDVPVPVMADLNVRYRRSTAAAFARAEALWARVTGAAGPVGGRQATGVDLDDGDGVGDGGRGHGGIGDVVGRLLNGCEGGSAHRHLLGNEEPGRHGRPRRSRTTAGCARGRRAEPSGTSDRPQLRCPPRVLRTRGLPDGAVSPVKSVSLREGAFSHFAFVPRLEFDPSRAGGLAACGVGVGGPVTVCFSSHDTVVGTFYPLASLTAGDDTSGAHSPMWRWGGMGADGAQNDDAALVGVQPAGSAYAFPADAILNVDASDVVCKGGPPSGAHSDIVDEELAWIVLTAAGLA